MASGRREGQIARVCVVPPQSRTISRMGDPVSTANLGQDRPEKGEPRAAGIPDRA